MSRLGNNGSRSKAGQILLLDALQQALARQAIGRMQSGVVDEAIGVHEDRKTGGVCCRTSRFPPQALVRIVEKLLEHFGVTGPGNRPGQSFDGTALDRDRDSLTFLQGELVRQLESAVFVNRVNLYRLHGSPPGMQDSLNYTSVWQA